MKIKENKQYFRFLFGVTGFILYTLTYGTVGCLFTEVMDRFPHLTGAIKISISPSRVN